MCSRWNLLPRRHSITPQSRSSILYCDIKNHCCRKNNRTLDPHRAPTLVHATSMRQHFFVDIFSFDLPLLHSFLLPAATECYLKISFPPYLLELDLHGCIDSSQPRARTERGILIIKAKKKEGHIGIWGILGSIADRKSEPEVRIRREESIKEQLKREQEVSRNCVSRPFAASLTPCCAVATRVVR